MCPADPAAARSANIFDVAKLAGVSHQTVSRVINDFPGVRPATRERVLVAIKQLRYQPSLAAQSLVTRRSRTIGVVTRSTADFGPASIQLHLNDAAAAARYSVFTVSAADSSDASARAAVESLLRQKVEAIVLVLLDAPMLEGLRALELGVPLIPIASGSGRGPLAVSIDQYEGARAATRHLIAEGYKNVAHVAGPRDHPDAQERLRGWADELAGQRLPRGEIRYGDWSAASGYRAGVELALRSNDAVFVGNDQMALGVLTALNRRGLHVPDDIGIVGFDDVPEAAFYRPPLTTVRQDFEALGRLAMRRVLDTLEETEGTEPAPLIPSTLVSRSSSSRVRNLRPAAEDAAIHDDRSRQ